MTSITVALSQLRNDDRLASEESLEIVYNELRRLAVSHLRRERAPQTLQPTALTHEAYLRLLGVKKDFEWRDRKHFFAAASETMRRILIERARSKKCSKAGGGLQRFSISEADAISSPEDWLIDLDDALVKLTEADENAAELVKLRVFVGLSLEESAEALGLSRSNAFRTWTFARAWLKSELSHSDE
jgi:RNA polymerase sigma factor (TIGR02999 family)